MTDATVREIARRHKVKRSAIQYRIRRFGWKKYDPGLQDIEIWQKKNLNLLQRMMGALEAQLDMIEVLPIDEHEEARRTYSEKLSVLVRTFEKLMQLQQDLLLSENNQQDKHDLPDLEDLRQRLLARAEAYEQKCADALHTKSFSV